MESIHCSVIIPARNRSTTIPFVLNSLVYQKEKWEGHEVVVVDNGSSDNTGDIVTSYMDKLPLRLISQAHQGGFEAAAVRNAGVAASRSRDVLIFLDSDVVVPPHFLSQHLYYHRKHNSACVIGSVVYVDSVPDIPPPCSKSGRASMKGYHDSLEKLALDFSERICMKNYAWLLAHSGNISTTYALFKKTGGFDTSFTTWSIEDLDFGFRLFTAGAYFIYSRYAFGYHIPHESSSPAIKQQTVRDGFTYMLKKYPEKTELIQTAADFWEDETTRHASSFMKKQFYNRSVYLRQIKKFSRQNSRQNAKKDTHPEENFLALAIIVWREDEIPLLHRTLLALGEIPFEIMVINAANSGSEKVEQFLQLYPGPLELSVFSTDWLSEQDEMKHQRLIVRLLKPSMNDEQLVSNIERNLVQAQQSLNQSIDQWIQARTTCDVVRYLAPGDEPGPGWITYISRVLRMKTSYG